MPSRSSAMKMENLLGVERELTVRKIFAKAENSVAGDAAILESV
jgi:acetyl/propionyl-CoA carboxylase alpha subunit